MKADTIVFFYYPQYHKKKDSHINSLFIAWLRRNVQDRGISIANAFEI